LPIAGNTCFVNAAMQCLRYTPGLPLMILPDLLDAVSTQPDSQPPTPTKGRASRTSSLS
jgi:ubiquitin C-terminal hydrolase